MKRPLSLTLLLALCAVVPARAQGDPLEDLNKALPGAAGDSVPEAAVAPARAAAEREWLVMVFINGRNNLWPAALADVNEMELAGSSDRVAVTAELGLLQDRGNSIRLYIEKDDSAEAADPFGAIVSQGVTVESSDMGSWRHFVDFARWSLRRYPAKKVLAILWNHGSGRVDIGGADNAGAELGIAYDDLTGNFIRNAQIGLALKEIGAAAGGQVAVYAEDACLMQMAEVIYEVGDHAGIVVGSEEIVPGEGLPYDKILSDLRARPSMTPAALARVITSRFDEHYEGPGQAGLQGSKGTAISAVRTSAVPGFIAALNAWVGEAATARHREPVLRALDKALAFEYGYDGEDTRGSARSRDLYDIVQRLQPGLDATSALYARGEALKVAIREMVLAKEYTGPNPAYARAGGVAVYVPKRIYDPSYDELLFSRDSRWDEFLKWKLDPDYRVR